MDDRRFRELLIESDDLQSDAMSGARTGLNAYVDAARDSPFATPVGTPSSKDVMALQTAAALENLAVSTYGTALTLPYVGGADALPMLTTFVRATMGQHADHAAAFNAAVTRLGGKKQTRPDPTYAPIVARAVPKITDAAGVIALAITLEDVAAATYTKAVGLVSTRDLRLLFMSVAGVEAQHKAILLAVRTLVQATPTDQLDLPADAARLPSALGGVSIPDVFYPTATAAPVAEGAVQ